jgi:predicted ATP-grasp superfamily ATP-dependent carboligase
MEWVLGESMRNKNSGIHWIEKPRSDLLVTGFKGIGQVGYLSIKYMIEHLDNIRRIGLYESMYLPPVVTVEEKQLSYPIEFYEYLNKFIIMKVEEIPVDSRGQYIIRKITRGLNYLGLKRIVSIGGLVSSLRENEKDRFRVVYNSYWDKKNDYPLAQRNVKIYGPLASVLYYSEIERIPSMAILAYADPDRPADFRGVYYALEACKDILNTELDLSELKETAEELEKRLKDLIETEIKSDREKYMYT